MKVLHEHTSSTVIPLQSLSSRFTACQCTHPDVARKSCHARACLCARCAGCLGRTRSTRLSCHGMALLLAAAGRDRPPARRARKNSKSWTRSGWRSERAVLAKRRCRNDRAPRSSAQARDRRDERRSWQGGRQEVRAAYGDAGVASARSRARQDSVEQRVRQCGEFDRVKGEILRVERYGDVPHVHVQRRRSAPENLGTVVINGNLVRL